MESRLLLATNVHSLFADLAMSMKEEKAIKHALSVKPDTNASKVSFSLVAIFSIFLGKTRINLVVVFNLKCNKFIQEVPELKVMKKRMILMIWRMNFILQTMILTTLLRLCLLLALILDAVPMSIDRGSVHRRSWIPPLLLQRSLS